MLRVDPIYLLFGTGNISLFALANNPRSKK